MHTPSPSRDPIYLAAAVPFAILTVAASFYDSAGYYVAPVVLCIAQFVRPTRIGWILITGAYALIAGALTCGIALDLVRLGGGQRPSILLDVDDSIFFGAMTVGTAALAWRLATRRKHHRPI